MQNHEERHVLIFATPTGAAHTVPCEPAVDTEAAIAAIATATRAPDRAEWTYVATLRTRDGTVVMDAAAMAAILTRLAHDAGFGPEPVDDDP